eukprot:TRINITY_DN7795_c0_g1_i1.p1 TRINITY_DN7795_c0_g1~~TRINITY_DN7795_c0_g1_i1.p1  ORF type:complete len:239 (+),score=13.46 TRINITY_DN7795_c0_g1_i1:92-808(+)
MKRTTTTSVWCCCWVVAVLCGVLWCGGVQGGNALYGVDLVNKTPLATWPCLNKTVQYAVVQIYDESGNFNPDALDNIKKGLEAGLKNLDALIMPCPTCSKTYLQQAADIVNTLTTNHTLDSILTFWVGVMDKNSWTGSLQANRVFLTGLITSLQKSAITMRNSTSTVGVFTTAADWSNIVGPMNTLNSNPLWYGNLDGLPQFTDFTPFGGWTAPSMKRYTANQTICSISVNEDFRILL